MPIGTATGVMMVSVAALFDLVQFFLNWIPFLGWILTSLLGVVAWLTFLLWFKMHGVDFVKPSRALTLGGGFLIELIPIVNDLPAWTVAVLILIASTRTKAHLGPQTSKRNLDKLKQKTKHSEEEQRRRMNTPPRRENGTQREGVE